MKKTKILSLVVATTLLASVLAGCTGGTDSASQTDSASGGETPVAFKADFGKYLTEEGFFKDVKSSDFVEFIDYKGISVSKEHYEVTDAEMQEQIDMMLENFTSYETLTEGEVKADSTVNIDYVGSVDGVEFEGGTTNGQGTEVTIGVTQYIDDFLEQLVGHKVGETFDINVTFPEDYSQTDLAGKDAVFNITINSLQGEKIVPELTDDFIKEQSTLKSVTEYKEQLSKGISAQKQDSYVWNTFVESVKAEEIPQSALDFETENMKLFYSNSAQQYGMSLEEYLSALSGGKTEKDFFEEQAENIKTNTSLHLAVLAVAEKEDMKITDEDIKTYLDVEDYSELEEAYGIEYIKFEVIRNQVYLLILDSAVQA